MLCSLLTNRYVALHSNWSFGSACEGSVPALLQDPPPCLPPAALGDITAAWQEGVEGGGRGEVALTCSVRRRVLRKNPKRQPMTTASTDMMSRPFCLQTFFTRCHTASRAIAMAPSHLSVAPKRAHPGARTPGSPAGINSRTG